MKGTDMHTCRTLCSLSRSLWTSLSAFWRWRRACSNALSNSLLCCSWAANSLWISWIPNGDTGTRELAGRRLELSTISIGTEGVVTLEEESSESGRALWRSETVANTPAPKHTHWEYIQWLHYSYSLSRRALWVIQWFSLIIMTSTVLSLTWPNEKKIPKSTPDTHPLWRLIRSVKFKQEQFIYAE